MLFFSFGSVCIWHTKTVLLLLTASQAYRLLLLCKWSFENLSSCVPHEGRWLVNLVKVTVKGPRPESDASRYTWTVPVCKFSLFRWRKNSRTPCLEFLRSRYFLLEINRTILLLLQRYNHDLQSVWNDFGCHKLTWRVLQSHIWYGDYGLSL